MKSQWVITCESVWERWEMIGGREFESTKYENIPKRGKTGTKFHHQVIE